jgi:two-component system, OmpR family, sensor kinase
LHVIAREAGRMGRLVTDLLTLARADERQRLARHRLALDTLLLEVYEQGRLLAGDVQIELNPFEQVAVDGDPDRLKQLLLNLIDNALRHTRAGGTVTIGVSSEGNWAVLRVADTGPGIQAEERERIFEPFYQGDQGRSGNSGGSGLGLAIARWIAEAHGGRIEVDSEIGAGSAFTIYLPGAFIDPSPPMVDVEQD